MSVMPIQKPGKSKQDYETPADLLEAVEARFGLMDVDLAATKLNAKCVHYITPEQDSLKQSWSKDWGGKLCWLNPPYGNIEPWAKKCAEYSYFTPYAKGRIFFLVPASIGANWYRNYVDGKGYVIALNGRLTFRGETTPYPKDCMIVIYGAQMRGFEVWNWRV